MLRILHVGLGPLGQRVTHDLVQRQIGRVVAAVDSSPELSGKLLAEVVPGAAPGLSIQRSLEEVDAWDRIDCALLTTSSDLPQCAPALRTLLSRGKSVVSSCEELAFPWARHRELADELHALAVEHDARLLGTGVNPGFLMDALPVFATGVCRNVRSVHVWRIQDATPRRIPFQKKIGAGLDLAQFEQRSRDGTLRHVGLCESIHFLAHCLRWPLESWDETLEPVVADRALSAGVGPIPAGHAAGVRQVARGFARGREVLRLEFQASIGQSDPHDRVLIDGDPPIDLVLRGGVHGDTATSAILLNALRPLLAAAPGLHTMATIPMACSTGV